MNLNIDIPQELYEQARQIAESQQLRVDDVLASALSDQLSHLRRLEERARRGNREKFLEVLDRVPDIAPEDYDRL